MKRQALALAFILLSLALFASDEALAARKVSLIERLEADFKSDPAFSAAEREAYLAAFRQELAGYAADVLSAQRMRGADVLMSVVVEGSFDSVEVERTVRVASAAYIAVRRGSDPDVVEGIALYGFRKKLDADKIEAWANGYNECVKFKVPTYIAEDLIYNAAERDWDVYAYNTFKWGLVDASKAGYDAEDFLTYMLGTYLKGGMLPGSVVSKSLTYFKGLKRSGAKPALPPYAGSFIPRLEKKQLAQEAVPVAPIAPTAPKVIEPAPAPPEVKAEEPGPVQETRKPEPEQKREAEAPRAESPRREPVDLKPIPKAPVEEGGMFKNLVAKLSEAWDEFLGAPYVWGGTTTRGTDCSGFVQSVFLRVNVRLPRRSIDMWETGRPVKREALRKGDLVFFKTIGNKVSHVGILAEPGEERFIHASSSRGVVYSKLNEKYYNARYAGARRVLAAEGAADLAEQALMVAALELSR